MIELSKQRILHKESGRWPLPRRSAIAWRTKSYSLFSTVANGYTETWQKMLWKRSGRDAVDAPVGPYDTNTDVVLERCEIAEVGTISHKGTLALLPPGKNGKQKMVVGDDTGAVHVLEMKKGEPTTVFKFTELEGAIMAVALGGTSAKRDKIFATQGSQAVGITKKGKEFFKLTSTLSEPIRFMRVHEAKIWTGCDFLYNQYDDGADAGFYMCRERITSLEVAAVSGDPPSALNAVLGCHDGCVRVIEGAELIAEVTVDGAVGAMTPCGGPGTGMERGIIYGTERGTVGHLACCSKGQGWLRKTWSIPSSKGSVSVVRCLDFTGSGRDDLVVGRNDGSLEVFRREDSNADGDGYAYGNGGGGGNPEGGSSGGFGDDDGVGGGRWQLWFEAAAGESIRSVECGVVSTAGYKEIIVLTYPGKLISFTTEPLRQADTGEQHGKTIGSIHSDNKIKQLQKDVAELEKRVAAEKEKLAASGGGGGSNGGSDDSLPPPPQFQVMSQYALDQEEAACVVTVEAPVPLDVVLLHATVHMDLLRSGDEASSGVIITATPPEKKRSFGASTVAVYRCQESTSRVVIKARTIEGNQGDVVLTAVARTQPARSGQVVRLKIKPLSLHSRMHVLTDEALARPKNVMRLTGAFSMGVIHDWIAGCLPGVPPKTQEEAAVLHFVNVFTRSVLTCEYRRGEAVVSSDSISAIAIVKEAFSREATARRIAISDTLQTNEDSIAHFIGLIHPKLQEQSLLARQVQLVAATTEIAGNDPDAPWLSEEYSHIVKNAKGIQKAFVERPRVLEYLTGIVTDIFVDWHKLKGHDVRHEVPELMALIGDYNRAALTQFITQKRGG